MILNILLILVGLVLLIFSADYLVKGAASVATRFNIAPLIIGLTIVSFGTSAPELTVNILSAIEGSSELALGNVLGSNIANILLVLGVVAVIGTIKVKSSTVWKEIPFALLAAFLLFIMANTVILDGASENIITRTNGIVLMAMMAVFMFYVFANARGGKSKHTDKMSDDTEEIEIYSTTKSTLFIIAGLVGLFFGGRLLVDNAVSLATQAGLSEALIGLTIVAIGTSLPELVTSVMAALKGHMDLAIGNVVGSNIFNIFWVIGLTSIILPLPVSAAIQTDMVMCIIATLLLFIFMFLGKKHQLSRVEGSAFITIYAGYLIFLVARG